MRVRGGALTLCEQASSAKIGTENVPPLPLSIDECEALAVVEGGLDSITA